MVNLLNIKDCLQQRFAAIGVLVRTLKLVLCLERWFLIYSFGLSNPQLQQATGVVGYFRETEK